MLPSRIPDSHQVSPVSSRKEKRTPYQVQVRLLFWSSGDLSVQRFLRSAAVPGSVSPRGRQLQRLVGHRLVKPKTPFWIRRTFSAFRSREGACPTSSPNVPPRHGRAAGHSTRRARPRGGAASTTSDRPAPQTRRQLAMGLNAVSLLPQRTWLAANRNHVDPCPKPSCPWPNHRQQPGGQRHSIEARPALSHRPMQ
jgi:hypothetical protein